MSEYRSLGMRMSPYADITQIRFTGLISASDTRLKHPGICPMQYLIYCKTGTFQNMPAENPLKPSHHLHICKMTLTLLYKVIGQNKPRKEA